MRLFLLASIACFGATCASGQLSPAPQLVSPLRSTGPLTLVAQINKGLNTKKAKIGDKVTVTVIQDVISAGKVLVRRGSKFIGHVSDVTPFSKADPRSRLAMVFDRGELKGGGALSVHGSIQALAPPIPDPRLEAIMSSSSYGGTENGHPVNGGLMSTGQTNASTPMAASRHRRSGVEELQAREKALDDAGHPQSTDIGPQGALSAGSHGVFGLPGLALSNAAQGPIIVTVGQHIELKSGTQIVLRLDDSVLQQ